MKAALTVSLQVFETAAATATMMLVVHFFILAIFHLKYLLLFN
jgi:hypothetical protein